MQFEPNDWRRLSEIRIACVVGFTHVTKRPKFIGKNAKRDVHGDRATETVIRIYTDAGLDGVGVGNISRERAETLIGVSLRDLWKLAPTANQGLGRADHALFDLTGKALGKPAWALLGGAGPARVGVYDTSLYFSDLLPEYADRGVSRLLQELDDGMQAGHRAFKIKVGRGMRWMDAEEGLLRDIAVVRALSDHAGPRMRLMADANDQFGPEVAKRFLDAVGDRVVLAEEMFPEEIHLCCEMRDWIADRGLDIKLADGESEHDPDVHIAFARAGALDVLQPDIRALGLRLYHTLSRQLGDLPQVEIAPHNWGSYLGTYMMLQLGRGVANFFIAEMDRSRSELFDDLEWNLRDGAVTVPATPGCGLRLLEQVFHDRYLPTAWAVGDTAAPRRYTPAA